MKVLILGGTGAMGEHLTQLLASTGNEVFVTSRRMRVSNDAGVRYIAGNAQDMCFLREILCQSWDAIIDFMVYSTVDFENRMSDLLGATSQYIFLSSSRVYAESLEPITESSPRLLDVSVDQSFLSSDDYALAKARQEDLLLNSGNRNWTIIRPYITYGVERLQLGVMEKESWLFRALQGRTIVLSADINMRVTTLTYGLDVSRGIKSIVGNSLAFGEVFHIASHQSLLWRDVFEIYLDVLKDELGYAPKTLLLGIKDFEECHFSKYQILYDRMYDRRIDSRKIGQFLDVDGFVRVESGLRKCLQDFLKNPKFRNINWKSEALKDKKSKEHSSIYNIPGFRAKFKYIFYRYLYI